MLPITVKFVAVIDRKYLGLGDRSHLVSRLRRSPAFRRQRAAAPWLRF